MLLLEKVKVETVKYFGSLQKVLQHSYNHFQDIKFGLTTTAELY